MNSDANLILSPLGTFEGKPTEGGQADAPEQSHIHHRHRLLFTKPLRILQLDGKGLIDITNMPNGEASRTKHHEIYLAAKS
jgi:hypothetical protein